MLKLKFISSGSIVPRDAQKIYFSCHEKDLTVYLNDISDIVLEYGNCAVFYNSAPSSSFDEEDKVALSEMQAFIVPVTHRFLSEESRSLNYEVPFAVENNIPILFLMMEKDLQTDFNEKCGNLHLISAIDDPDFDRKAISFLEKVLVSEELTRKIKDSFGAYIFLSYRKKDKEHAKRLMRLIHKDERLRDVAIWYDEFLMSGEDFNKSIENALKKSKVFALAVTPNLLEKGNYIMSTEYPMAQREGKEIIPVELVDTDKSKLSQSYAGIPSPVRGESKDLYSRLENGVCAPATRMKNAEHDYLIGLAYLNGVDVETDKEKAIKIITEASCSGYAPAKEKLAELYSLGDGVGRNLYRAIELRNELHSQYKDAIRKNRSLADILGLGRNSVEADGLYNELYLSDCNDTDRRSHARIITEALKILEENGASRNRELLEVLAHIYSVIGSDVALSELLPYNDIEKARMLVKSAELYNELVKTDKKYESELAHVYSVLGNLLYLTDKEEAYRMKSRAMEIYSSRLKENTAYAYELSREINGVSELAIELDYYDEAEKLAKKSISILNTAIAIGEKKGSGKHTIALLLIQLNMAYHSLLDIYRRKGEEYRTIEAITSCIDKYEGKATDPAYGYHNLLASLYSELGSIYMFSEDSSYGEYYYSRALSLSRQLYDSGDEAGPSALVNALTSMADYYSYVDENFTAASYYREAIGVRREENSDLTAGYYPGANGYDLADMYSHLSDIYFKCDDTDSALSAISDALGIVYELNTSFPDDTKPIFKSTELYSKASFIYKMLGDTELQTSVTERRIELLEDILTYEKNDYEIKEYLKACAESYNELGEIYYDMMEEESALNMYGAAMDKLSSIDTESIDEIAYLSGTVLYNMARVYYDMGDRRNALDCARMSVEILERDQVLGSLIIDDVRELLRMIKGR